MATLSNDAGPPLCDGALSVPPLPGGEGRGEGGGTLDSASFQEGWTTTTVGKIAATTPNALVGGPFGSNLVSADYVLDGTPVIRGQNMGRGRWIDGEFAFVDSEKARELRANIARPGDILFTQRGTLGQVAIVPVRPFDEYVISQSQMKLTVDPVLADHRFIYYYFSSEQQQEYIKANAIQTGVPHTNLGQLRTTQVLLPPLPEQQAIAATLGSLDEKIELNRRMNRTLEELARAIFRSWFVDFDPVRAKAAGRAPVGMDAATAALFPAGFAESELGLIPEGWRVGTIGQEVDVVGGSTPSTSNHAFWDGGISPFATPKDLSQLQAPVVLDTERHITETGVGQISSGVLPVGTVLLSSRAPIGYLATTAVQVSVNQGFIAMICRSELPNHYVRLWADHNMDGIKARANGTTFLEVSKSNFRPMPVLVPDRSVLDSFCSIVEPLFERVICNLRETATLAATRDYLLPKLLSGEVRVGDALTPGLDALTPGPSPKGRGE